MTPEFQFFFTLAGSVTVAVLGFLLKSAWDEIRALRNNLSELREDIPKTYITKGEITAGFSSINSRLDQLFILLQNKVDKEHAR